MATAIANVDAAAPVTMSAEAERFQLMQRQARMFAMSPLVPQSLRNGSADQAMANCYIAMSIADRMGEDRMTVMQNIIIVHGTAGFKAQYMIARANASGVFRDGIDWEINGKGADLSATAFATLASTGKRVEITVDMAMAKAEGWSSNKKYQTMPEVMLRYRSATFLVRMYAPQVMLGHQTTDEIEDTAASAMPIVAERRPLTAAALLGHSEPEAEPQANDGTLSDDNPSASEGRGEEDQGERITDDLISGMADR